MRTRSIVAMRRLSQIDSHYLHHESWTPLKELAENPLYTWARKIRDQFTHERRLPSELHGETIVSRVFGESERGIDASTPRIGVGSF
jgi:hypothetical protein